MHVVHDPATPDGLIRLLGVDDVAEEQELARVAEAHDPREQVGRAHVGAAA